MLILHVAGSDLGMNLLFVNVLFMECQTFMGQTGVSKKPHHVCPSKNQRYCQLVFSSDRSLRIAEQLVLQASDSGVICSSRPVEIYIKKKSACPGLTKFYLPEKIVRKENILFQVTMSLTLSASHILTENTSENISRQCI